MDTAMSRRQEALPWWLPVCCMLTSLRPITGLSFPPEPCQWAQLELFISWWMGLNNPENGEREREWAIANSPISHLSFSSSLQLLWAMERLSRPSPYLSVSQQKQRDFSLGRKLDICICSKKSRRVSAKHKKYPYGPERPLGFMTEGLNG